MTRTEGGGAVATRRYGKQDWIVAALAALAEGGIEAVRIEKLARRLNTSKGSFYWHFTDRPALLTAVLNFWEAEGTSLVIISADTIANPAERMRAVVDAALVATEQGIDVARTESALRAWAAEEPIVAQQVAAVDKRRIGYLAEILKLTGYDSASAIRLGTGIYFALIGLYDMRRYAPSLADDHALYNLVEGILTSAPQK